MAFTAGTMKTWKNLAWEESFFLSGFWGFGTFSENLLSPRQRASVKVSTMTRPQTMLVALLLQPRLRCVTTRPGLMEGWEGGRSFLLHPLHRAASPASPTPHCASSSAFPRSPLATQLPSQDSSLPTRAARGVKHPSTQHPCEQQQ